MRQQKSLVYSRLFRQRRLQLMRSLSMTTVFLLRIFQTRGFSNELSGWSRLLANSEIEQRVFIRLSVRPYFDIHKEIQGHLYTGNTSHVLWDKLIYTEQIGNLLILFLCSISLIEYICLFFSLLLALWVERY